MEYDKWFTEMCPNDKDNTTVPPALPQPDEAPGSPASHVKNVLRVDASMPIAGVERVEGEKCILFAADAMVPEFQGALVSAVVAAGVPAAAVAWTLCWGGQVLTGLHASGLCEARCEHPAPFAPLSAPPPPPPGPGRRQFGSRRVAVGRKGAKGNTCV